MSRRQEQLNSRIHEILTTVVQSEMRDPRLQLVNVTRVQVNRDASHAMIYFTSSDPDYTHKEVEEAMTRATGYFRSVLAEMLDLRYTPNLTFRYDDAAEETARVLELFEKLAAEREANPPQSEEDEARDE